ncbi:deoxynucleotidyltransferase terminal-interacting protein 2 [Haemorhous mexicanus]|uniref:deoxynucleotidyltransferase terminal-interacting protein 2 n=1 Tax=Haemorhous mexicanus TaxID=30427 RepID=UPI0028BD91A3|nr:deoxynucleotidyltransferase terminal-interacting protein 2 [Haemorhous mexicanus]
MVNTRRAAARRREQGARAGGGSSLGDADPDADPAGAAEVGSAEISTPVARRMTRRTKSVRKPEVIQECQFEESEHAEMKSDVSDSSEMQITRNEGTAVPSAQSVAEPQVDGDVSEAESNCSSVSGLQTPLFVRITRRRQIVIPYQPDSADKKRHDNTAFVNKLRRILDEDDVSEAESCSSAVSGVQMPTVPTSTRSRQSKKKLQLHRVPETQSENTSDAESCCLSSLVEPCVTPKRITRSMQMKPQTENTKQTGKKNRFVSEDENVIEDTIKSDPIIISDSRPTAELVNDMENASILSDGNKEPSSPKSKCANAAWSEDTKEEILNDVASSLKKTKQSDTKSPVKKTKKNTQSAEIDHSEAICGQIQEDHSEILARKGKLEHVSVSLTDCMSPKQFLESQGQVTPNESKEITECERADAEADAQQSFSSDEKLRKSKQASAVSSPSADMAVAQTAESIGKSRMLKIDVDSADNQTEEYEVSHSSEKPSSDNNSLALFLSNSESDDSDNSDVADIDTVDENLCYKKSDEKTPSSKKSLKSSSLHVEGLFVIDTEPGMSSSHKYYLDNVDQESDAKSKHEGGEKDKESDLEEDEEELIDEDEKDEDDDLLKNKVDVLHLSSSIDPGLNIKKLGGLYISFDAKNQKPRLSAIEPQKKKKDQLLQKSVITPDFERKECVPPYRESLNQLKKQRRAEREKTTGDGWFGMKAPEITSELKNDLKVLKMRASLDPKHFYKKNDRDGLPKYFQVGTVVDSPIDFYHSRIPKKQRKRTIVEELLADSEFRRYNKKKYQEIMSEKAAFAAGKRNRKKKKFHN